MTKEQLAKLKELKGKVKKEKPFKNLSTPEKWELVETIAKMLGLIQ